MLSKNIQFCIVIQNQRMRYFKLTKSSLHKFILVGWAVAVVWIYMGNLVNFHLHHIWGKQLIPVACSSTRYKEEDSASVVKNDTKTKTFYSSLHFDFASPDQQISYNSFLEVVSFQPNSFDAPVLKQGIQAFSFRGPPIA